MGKKDVSGCMSQDKKDISGCMAHLGRFIQEELGKKNHGTLDVRDNLIESGIIDAIGIQRILAFLESRFSIDIKDEEMIPENFESIESIESFIKNKIG